MSSTKAICSACQQLEATHFGMWFKGGLQTKLELCDVCFQEHSQSLGMSIPDLSNARCDHCGGSPAGAFLRQPLLRGPADSELEFTCLACSLVKGEESERLAAEWRAAGEPLFTINATKQFMTELDRRVQIRISGGEEV
jgi:hypothetical protein